MGSKNCHLQQAKGFIFGDTRNILQLPINNTFVHIIPSQTSYMELSGRYLHFCTSILQCIVLEVDTTISTAENP